MRRGLLLLLLLLLCVPCCAQLKLPRLPGLGGGGIKIPGLDKILKDEPGLSTSFEDAITGVRYYDDFNPPVGVAMAEMPRGMNHAFMLAPGGYEVILESYCLHAGTHGPGKGEGYLYAPLKGSLAGPISDIMDKSVDHPEIPQRDIQALIWGIESKAKISEMPENLQDAASKLLSSSQIDRLNGGALGKIPPELMNQAFGKLPPAARQVMEVKATLRNMLSQAMPDFGAVEQVAVLAGDPPDDGEVVPRERWSYRPGGCFVRYQPYGYQETRTQVFVPDDVEVRRDEQGRIVSLADRAGRRIDITYDDQVAPLKVAGEDGLTGWAVARVCLSRPEPGEAQTRQQVEMTGQGWLFTGLASGNGRLEAAQAPFAGAADRYAQAVAHLKELNELAANVRKVGKSPANSQAAAQHVALMADLASVAAALRQMLEANSPDAPWAQQLAELPREAWGNGLVAIGEGGTAAGQVGQAPMGPLSPLDGLRLAASPASGQRLALWGAPSASLAPMPWSRNNTRLRPFDPSGSATPANRGRQRIGQSSRPSREQRDAGVPPWNRDPDAEDETPPTEPSSDKSILDRAKNAIDWIGKGMDAVNVVTDPVGTVAGKVGMGVQDKMQSAYFDWLFDTAGKISEALGGDPPRPDFNIIAQPEPLPGSGAPFDWGDVSPERAAALTALRQSLEDLVSKLRAGEVSVDRLGGAIQAGDEQWASQQSEALLHWKRQSGAAMIVVADRMDALVAVLRAEGHEDTLVTPDIYANYQQAIRDGFSPARLEAAQLLGLTEQQIERVRQERLAAEPGGASGLFLSQFESTAKAMRELGARWVRLPDPELSQ